MGASHPEALPAEALPAEALPAEALPAEALPAEAQSAEALEVLREVWRSQGQAAAAPDDGCEARSCRRMTDAGVGFGDFAAGDADGRPDLAAAWRNRLKREGKYNAAGGTVRDLIMGPRS